MLEDWTNPDIAQAKADEYGLTLYRAKNRTKKYMVLINGRVTNFGAMGYEDFTFHGDEKRRAAFRRRNRKWEFAPFGTPAWLSYHILW